MSGAWRTVGDPLVAGAASGPLARVRVAVKDVVAVAGQRVGAGCPTWLAEAVPEPRHAPAVTALLAAGADVRGVAVTDELAWSLTGRDPRTGGPPNGAAPGRLPGGSTSGPASAVALGEADLGLGTDTAGSLRVPASYQGLWGLRTTHGLVPREGVLPLAPTFDTVGWLARDPDLLHRALVATVGTAAVPDDGASDEVDLVVDPGLLAAAGGATRSALEALLDLWRARGHRVREVVLPSPVDVAEAFTVVQAAEARRAHGAWVRAHPGALGPVAAARFAAAESVTAEQERAARWRLEAHGARVRALLGCRVLVQPATPGPAPPLSASEERLADVRSATLQLTTPTCAAGLPALSAPLLVVDGAPVGVALVGAAGSDGRLVRLAGRLARDAAGAAAGVAAGAAADRRTPPPPPRPTVPGGDR